MVTLIVHPETRIVAAVNAGAEYDVNEMDPALLRRFWVCDLEPTTEDWISWAGEEKLDSVLIDFIRQNPAHLRVDPTQVEPGAVAPNPASWHRLADTYASCEMNPSVVAGTRPEGFTLRLLASSVQRQLLPSPSSSRSTRW